eukprot:jgi/Tetstr1/427376/TSEL_017540.t1
MARVQSSTPGGGVDWQFRCCDGGCGRTYRRPAPLCTHVNHGMESDDPEVAAMHLAYAETFDPSVYLRCVPRDGCPRSGHHVFHGAQAAARAATCEFCSPLPPTAPSPGVALPASAACVRALQRQHAPAATSAAHDAALAATARWWATSDVYRKMPRTPLRGTAVGVCPAARPVLFPLLDRTLAYADRFPPTDDRSYGAEGAVCVFAGLLLRSYPSSSPAVVRKLAERRVRLWEAGDAVRAGFSELRRARQALDTADLGMVSDAAAALPALDALHPPPAATGPEYSPPEEPPDLQRAPPSWGDNADEVMRGPVFALHKDDPAREEREKSGERLRVRPLGVGSVLVRLASAHALGQVGADAREVMGPVQRSFQSGAGWQRFAGQPTCSGGAAERLDLLELAQSGRVGAKSVSAEDDYLAVPELLQRAESGYEAVRPVSRVPGLFPLSTDLTNEYLKQDDRRLPAQEEYLWMSCFGAHMAALFVALDELLPYVPATNQDFNPYLARARNHAEAIDKAFRFRLAFLRKLNEIKRWQQLQVAGVGEDVAADVDVAAKDAFGSDELGQRTLDLLSSSLSAQTLKSYAGRLSQFAEFCHDSENISPLEATTATVVRYVAWIGERGHIAAKSLQPYLSAINTFFELHNLVPIAKDSLHLTSARQSHLDYRALLASVVNFLFFARGLPGVFCRVQDVHVDTYNITLQIYREKGRAGRRGPGDLRSFADDCGAATAAAHVPRVFDEYCTELSKVGLVVQDSKTRYVRHPRDSESELRTVREKLAPGGFRTPADDPVQDGAVYLGAPISHYLEWMTGALGRRREAHATLLERIASFGTSGYGCHHGAMRLLVVCAVRQTGFLSRMMPPPELDPFLAAVDAANISAAFSLLGLDACDQSTPRMEAAIVHLSMPADFGGLNLALLQSEAPTAAFHSAQSVVLPSCWYYDPYGYEH